MIRERQLIDIIQKALFFNQTDLDDVVEAIVEKERVKLSDILKASHIFCDNFCNLYTPCHVGEYIRENSELYDSEIPIFREILDLCEYNIIIDVVPYSADEYNAFHHVSEVSFDDRLRQLYTLILDIF